MRLDHIAYRVKDKFRTAKFFIDCFNYRIPEELPDGFEITFEDGSKSLSLVLIPPEVINPNMPWKHLEVETGHEYHLAPEIFISEGSPGSAVGDWVSARGGVGGIHHLAYQVDSVEKKVAEWRKKGFGEFATEKPLKCDGLTQIFTQSSELTGVIYEFIEREQHGFCRTNVKDLMKSTKVYSKVL